MNNPLANLINLPLSLAQTTPAATGGQPAWAPIVTMGLMFVVFYFLLIRPQSKARKELEKLIASVKTGDKIVTNGGLLGVVTNVKEKTVMVRIAENVKVELLKSAITSVSKEEAIEVVKAS